MPCAYYGIYASPKTANVPYTSPIIPPNVKVAQRANSADVAFWILVPLTVGINTFANIITPSVIDMIPLTNGLAINNNTSNKYPRLKAYNVYYNG